MQGCRPLQDDQADDQKAECMQRRCLLLALLPGVLHGVIERLVRGLDIGLGFTPFLIQACLFCVILDELKDLVQLSANLRQGRAEKERVFPLPPFLLKFLPSLRLSSLSLFSANALNIASVLTSIIVTAMKRTRTPRQGFWLSFYHLRGGPLKEEAVIMRRKVIP